MELHELKIKSLIELETSDRGGQKEIAKINDLIAKGWVLINTYKTCYDPQAFPNHQYLHYVLVQLEEEN
ncbi:MAG: hypothetical protein JM58_09200 [Peptococcaceae bacterium BICA1-8]|nr:MAG: hypothetical protein JM58_09200 [Peptococcaceae bacterium BICA1-8]